MPRPATVILDIPVRSSPLSNGRLSKSLTKVLSSAAPWRAVRFVLIRE